MAAKDATGGPRVSVYIPLHNGGPFIGEAIASILRQTIADLELVIVENGSSDDSLARAQDAATADERVRVIDAGEALGVAGAGNRAVAACRAPTVARMDQDDRCAAGRLEAQLRALDGDPGAVAVGVLADGIDADGARVRPADLWRLARGSRMPPFPHGSLMVRRAAFDRVGGYRAGAGHWEDSDLLLRLLAIGRVRVVPRVLYSYRHHAASATSEPGAGSPSSLGPELAALRAQLAPQHRDGARLWAGLPPGDSAAGGAGGVAHRARRRWHARHPASLRAAIRLALHARNVAARAGLRETRAVDWSPVR